MNATSPEPKVPSPESPDRDPHVDSLSELLRELNSRRLDVIEQQNRVDKFVLNLLDGANFSNASIIPPGCSVFPEYRR